MRHGYSQPSWARFSTSTALRLRLRADWMGLLSFGGSRAQLLGQQGMRGGCVSMYVLRDCDTRLCAPMLPLSKALMF